MSTIAFVPAADRSLLRRSFSGRPLLYWCVRALSDCNAVDRTVVSTADDSMHRLVEGFQLPGVDLTRGAEGPDRMLTAFLREAKLDAKDRLIVVPKASPFLIRKELDLGIAEFEMCGADRLVSVCRSPKRVFSADGSLLHAGALVENGVFRVSPVGKALLPPQETRLYRMADHTALDLSTPEGFGAAEAAHRNTLPDLYPALGGIRMLLTDVDGVLTDAGMYLSESGDELKKFSTRDGMAFALLRQRGLKIGIITGEDTEIVARRAKKLKADHLHQGIGDKLPMVLQICEQEGIEPGEVAYVGDDIGDLTALRAVGFAACPGTAEPTVKRAAHYICERGGGEGCVREVAEMILAAQSKETD